MATSVVEAALKMTFGVFVSKAQSLLVDKLKDGDVTSQNIREFLVDSMDDIKSRIDALTLSELGASADFVRDGLLWLNSVLVTLDNLDKLDRLDELCERSDASVKIATVYQSRRRMFRMPKFRSPFTFDDGFRYVVRFRSWLHRSDEKKTVSSSSSFENYIHFNAEKLSKSISIIKERSPEAFETAMKYFYDANTSATKVFRNATLKLEDRILATKLRIQSSLLMSLHNPSQAKLCKNYLKDLHELPEIAKNFRHDLEGGLLTQFNEDKRHDVVMSVSMINFALFRFLHCSSRDLITVYDWPLIEDGDWMYNPLIPDKAIMKELQSHEFDAPNVLSLEPIQSKIAGINPKLAAVNSEGELFLIHQQTNLQVCELLKISGRTVEVFYTFEKFTLVSFLTISSHDSVYVFVDSVQSNAPPGYVMYCVLGFDVIGDIIGKYENFLLPDSAIIMAPTPWEHDVALCISEKIQKVLNISEEAKMQVEQTISDEEKLLELELSKNSAVMRQGKKVEILENHSVKLILANLEVQKSSLVTITDKHHVIAVEQSGHHVRVFNKRGELAGEFDLHEGEREACVGITFNNLTKKIVVVSRLQNDFFLSTYLLETGKRCHHVRLSHIPQDCKELQLTSHGHGSIVLVTKEHVLFIQ